MGRWKLSSAKQQQMDDEVEVAGPDKSAPSFSSGSAAYLCRTGRRNPTRYSSDTSTMPESSSSSVTASPASYRRARRQHQEGFDANEYRRRASQTRRSSDTDAEPRATAAGGTSRLAHPDDAVGSALENKTPCQNRRCSDPDTLAAAPTAAFLWRETAPSPSSPSRAVDVASGKSPMASRNASSHHESSSPTQSNAASPAAVTTRLRAASYTLGHSRRAADKRQSSSRNRFPDLSNTAAMLEPRSASHSSSSSPSSSGRQRQHLLSSTQAGTSASAPSSTRSLLARVVDDDVRGSFPEPTESDFIIDGNHKAWRGGRPTPPTTTTTTRGWTRAPSSAAAPTAASRGRAMMLIEIPSSSDGEEDKNLAGSEKTSAVKAPRTPSGSEPGSGSAAHRLLGLSQRRSGVRRRLSSATRQGEVPSSSSSSPSRARAGLEQERQRLRARLVDMYRRPPDDFYMSDVARVGEGLNKAAGGASFEGSTWIRRANLRGYHRVFLDMDRGRRGFVTVEDLHAYLLAEASSPSMAPRAGDVFRSMQRLAGNAASASRLEFPTYLRTIYPGCKDSEVRQMVRMCNFSLPERDDILRRLDEAVDLFRCLAGNEGATTITRAEMEWGLLRLGGTLAEVDDQVTQVFGAEPSSGPVDVEASIEHGLERLQGGLDRPPPVVTRAGTDQAVGLKDFFQWYSNFTIPPRKSAAAAEA